MKSATAAMQGYLDDTCATLSTALKLTATDGTILGFSNYTTEFTFEGTVYMAAAGQTPTALESNASLSVDNLDVETIRSIDALTGPDILNGKWDFADMRLFIINPNDIPAGPLKLRRGSVGKISLTRQKITSEVRGMMEALSKQILELYSPGCRVDLGSVRCGVRLDPPFWVATTPYTVKPAFEGALGSVVKPITPNNRHFVCTIAGTSGASEPAWNTGIGATTVDGGVTWTAIQALTVTGSVTGVSTASKRVFLDTSRTEADMFFQGGLITFTSGLNVGRSMEVKLYTLSSGEIQLILPLAFVIAVSDTYTLTAGCFKRQIDDCKTKFDNSHNFQGEAYVQQNFEISPARVDQSGGGK